MSNEVKHTPGPWIAAPYSSVVGAPVVAASGRPVASVTYFKVGEGFENHDRESKANGNLIAASPEMLEALILHKKFADHDDAGPNYGGLNRDTHPEGEKIWSEWWSEGISLCGRAMKATDAAIAKATGK